MPASSGFNRPRGFMAITGVRVNRMFVHSFMHSYTHSFIHSVIHLNILPFLGAGLVAAVFPAASAIARMPRTVVQNARSSSRPKGVCEVTDVQKI